jgi:hypothetical protein
MPFHHHTASIADRNDRGNSLIPECGIVPTNSDKISLIRSSYVLARNEIIQKSIEQLLEYAPQTWICSKYLFNSQTLPASISVSKFGMEVWKSTDDMVVCSNGTEIYSGNNGTVLLRHKFDDGYYYYRASTLPNQYKQWDKSELQELVEIAVQERKNITCDPKNLVALTNAMALLLPQALSNVMAAMELRVGIVPRTYTISWKKQLVTYIQC